MASLNPFTGVLGTRRAAHLLRRTTFGPTRALIDAYAQKTPAEAVAALVDVQPIHTYPIDHQTNATWVQNFSTSANSEEGYLKQFVIGWWLDNARRDDTILHKMLLFLNQNWTASYKRCDSEIFYDYLKLLEYFAVGSYKTLAIKICFNNAILVYLNGDLNIAESPNENFAREYLELFTIGKGSLEDNTTTYTENDVKEAARVFTGCRYAKSNDITDPDTGIRKCIQSPSRHDTEDKYFSEYFQNTVIQGQNTADGMYTEVSDFVNMVFNKTETAKNICRKMYRYFVYSHISAEVENDIITPLAQLLKSSNYELKPVLTKLLTSLHFYDADDANDKDEIIGAKIKSPLELLFGAMRFFNIQPPNASTNTFEHYYNFYRESVHGFFLENCGMKLFYPDNVAGYPAYYQPPDYDRLWINSATIAKRYTLPRMFLENKRILIPGYFFAPFNILDWVKENVSDPGDGTMIVDEITKYIFPEDPANSSRFDFFCHQLLLGSLSLTNWRMEWNNYVTTQDGSSIEPNLQKLFTGILFSQEFQLQ